MPSRETEVCPHCGAEFPAGRLACPECGSDNETGWSEDGITGYAHGLPDEFTDDDYDRIAREIGAAPQQPATPATARAFIRFALWLLFLALLTWSLVVMA